MAGEWDVVEQKPASEWDVVSTAPDLKPEYRGAPVGDVPGDPRYQPPQRRAPATPSMRQKIVGAVEAALDVAAKAAGGGLGFFGGALGGMAGMARMGSAGREDFERSAMEGAERGAGAASGAMRDMMGGISPTGEEYSDTASSALQGIPAVIAGPGGTVGMGARATGVRPALRAIGDVARSEADLAGAAVGDSARQVGAAVAPTISPRNMKRVGAAVDAGIPVSPHQLVENKFVKLLGETAENMPLAGGGELRRTRREKLSGALARLIDENSDAKVLDDATFAKLQDDAGQRIGEITSRTDVPLESFEGLADVARRDTPDVQAAISTYVQDLQQIAEANGGVVPGDVLRKLRTEAQTQERGARASKGDLANALSRLTQRIDDAVGAHAPEGDIAALAAARKSYAVSKALEPLLAKHPDGNFPVTALKSVITNTKQGKRRVARGEGGEAADYAELGQRVLKELPSSGTAERNLIYSLARGEGAPTPGVLGTSLGYTGAAAYNLLGHRLVKRLVEMQRRREAPEKFPVNPDPEPTLEQGFEPPRGPQGGAPAQPLGDLTPDWQTAPGAAPGGAPLEVVPTEGLVPAVDETQPMRVQNGAEPPAARRGAGDQVLAIEGRPDLPDAMVAGGPAEVGATDATGAAMQTPDAALARREQRAEVEKVRQATQSPAVQAVLDQHEKTLAKRAAEEAAAQKRQADAAELRRAAGMTADPELKQALFDRAKKLEDAEKVPVATAKEGQPDLPEGKPAKAVPAGAAEEVPVEVIEPENPDIPVGEATEVTPGAVAQPVRVAREPEAPRGRKKPLGKSNLVPGRIYRDSNGNKAIYQADGTWKEVK